jgi:hypothetical protein
VTALPADDTPKRQRRSRRHPDPGRPSALTGTVHADGTVTRGEVPARILADVADCAHRHIAARAAGIHRDTINGWLERARDEQERIAAGETPRRSEALCVAFSVALEAADAQAQVNIGREVREGVRRHPDMGLRLLARRYPAEWGDDPQRVELSGPGGTPLVAPDPAALRAAVLDVLADVAARKAAATAPFELDPAPDDIVEA